MHEQPACPVHSESTYVKTLQQVQSNARTCRRHDSDLAAVLYSCRLASFVLVYGVLLATMDRRDQLALSACTVTVPSSVYFHSHPCSRDRKARMILCAIHQRHFEPPCVTHQVHSSSIH